MDLATSRWRSLAPGDSQSAVRVRLTIVGLRWRSKLHYQPLGLHLDPRNVVVDEIVGVNRCGQLEILSYRLCYHRLDLDGRDAADRSGSIDLSLE